MARSRLHISELGHGFGHRVRVQTESMDHPAEFEGTIRGHDGQGNHIVEVDPNHPNGIHDLLRTIPGEITHAEGPEGDMLPVDHSPLEGEKAVNRAVAKRVVQQGLRVQEQARRLGLGQIDQQDAAIDEHNALLHDAVDQGELSAGDISHTAHEVDRISQSAQDKRDRIRQGEKAALRTTDPRNDKGFKSHDPRLVGALHDSLRSGDHHALAALADHHEERGEDDKARDARDLHYLTQHGHVTPEEAHRHVGSHFHALGDPVFVRTGFEPSGGRTLGHINRIEGGSGRVSVTFPAGGPVVGVNIQPELAIHPATHHLNEYRRDPSQYPPREGTKAAPRTTDPRHDRRPGDRITTSEGRPLGRVMGVFGHPTDPVVETDQADEPNLHRATEVRREGGKSADEPLKEDLPKFGEKVTLGEGTFVPGRSTRVEGVGGEGYGSDDGPLVYTTLGNYYPQDLRGYPRLRDRKDLGNWQYKLADSNSFGMDVMLPARLDVDEKRMAAWICYADGNSRDGVGDLLEVTGIVFDRHRKNPVSLFDHGKQVTLPIALTEDPDNGEYCSQIDAMARQAWDKMFFWQGKGNFPALQKTGSDGYSAYDHALFCEQLFHLLSKKFLRGGSIGYSVIQASPLYADPQKGIPQGMHLQKVLKLESSVVVMPANMDTVRGSKGLEFVREILCMGGICGKPPSPYLVKSLQGYSPPKPAMMGWEPRGEVQTKGEVCGCQKGVKARQPRMTVQDLHDKYTEAHIGPGLPMSRMFGDINEAYEQQEPPHIPDEPTQDDIDTGRYSEEEAQRLNLPSMQEAAKRPHNPFSGEKAAPLPPYPPQPPNSATHLAQAEDHHGNLVRINPGDHIMVQGSKTPKVVTHIMPSGRVHAHDSEWEDEHYSYHPEDIDRVTPKGQKRMASPTDPRTVKPPLKEAGRPPRRLPPQKPRPSGQPGGSGQDDPTTKALQVARKDYGVDEEGSPSHAELAQIEQQDLASRSNVGVKTHLYTPGLESEEARRTMHTMAGRVHELGNKPQGEITADDRADIGVFRDAAADYHGGRGEHHIAAFAQQFPHEHARRLMGHSEGSDMEIRPHDHPVGSRVSVTRYTGHNQTQQHAGTVTDHLYNYNGHRLYRVYLDGNEYPTQHSDFEVIAESGEQDKQLRYVKALRTKYRMKFGEGLEVDIKACEPDEECYDQHFLAKNPSWPFAQQQPQQVEEEEEYEEDDWPFGEKAVNRRVQKRAMTQGMRAADEARRGGAGHDTIVGSRDHAAERAVVGELVSSGEGIASEDVPDTWDETTSRLSRASNKIRRIRSGQKAVHTYPDPEGGSNLGFQVIHKHPEMGHRIGHVVRLHTDLEPPHAEVVFADHRGGQRGEIIPFSELQRMPRTEGLPPDPLMGTTRVEGPRKSLGKQSVKSLRTKYRIALGKSNPKPYEDNKESAKRSNTLPPELQGLEIVDDSEDNDPYPFELSETWKALEEFAVRQKMAIDKRGVKIGDRAAARTHDQGFSEDEAAYDAIVAMDFNDSYTVRPEDQYDTTEEILRRNRQRYQQ